MHEHDERNLKRRHFLTTAAIGTTVGMFGYAPRAAASTLSKAGAMTMTQLAQAPGAGTTALRPFQVNIPQADVDALRARVKATRWSDKETVNDQSQGVQLAFMQELLGYWGADYDWRKVEARLNSLPMFVTAIDGLDIQFIHVKSKQPNTLPLIITHGWPGSILELLNVIEPLTNPTAHGGRADDAFDLVLPSMPGFAFSGKPTVTGWDPDHIAQAWAQLMQRLGYTRYVAQGGDWGAAVSESMARQAPPGLLGIHVNLPAAIPNDVLAALAAGGPAPAGLSEQERVVFNNILAGDKKGNGAYLVMFAARPQIVGYGATDSPVGLAAWILNHPGFAQWTAYGGDPAKSPTNLTKDDVLDEITLYWLTNSATSSIRIYWENKGRSARSAAALRTNEIKLPVGVTVFPGEVYQAPESWARRAYPNLIYFNVVDKGGHFAAWEQPELYTSEIRAAFRPLRNKSS